MDKTILIADDEKDWALMLAIRLEHEGYQLQAAFDTIHAMKHVVLLRPDLVLLDIMMPGGGGLQVLKNMRENIKLFSIPVIVVTTKGDVVTKERAEKYCLSGYFIKPVDMGNLLARIRDVLCEKRAKVSGSWN